MRDVDNEGNANKKMETMLQETSGEIQKMVQRDPGIQRRVSMLQRQPGGGPEEVSDNILKAKPGSDNILANRERSKNATTTMKQDPAGQKGEEAKRPGEAKTIKDSQAFQYEEGKLADESMLEEDFINALSSKQQINNSQFSNITLDMSRSNQRPMISDYSVGYDPDEHLPGRGEELIT